MTPKPAYTRLKQLLHTTWWLDLSGSTDTHGTLTRRAFYGQYTITTGDREHLETYRVLFPEAAAPLVVTLRPASKNYS